MTESPASNAPPFSPDALPGIAQEGAPGTLSLEELLRRSSSLHRHLCPRQVLGVRMGVLAGRELSLDLPQEGKRLLTIVETDGCAADGISVATHCWVGHRTLRVEDYGKIGATFVDTESKRAVRIVPQRGIREAAISFAPEGRNRWERQLLGYQRMPDELLLRAQEVELAVSLRAIISRAGERSECSRCGEEVMNERWIVREGEVLCKPCAGERYYRPVESAATAHTCDTRLAAP